MSISQYQIFVKAVEQGSFTKAAAQLGFTQSGVSHAISALEGELGLTLLHRDRSGISLTADGRQLLPYLQAMCNLQHRMEETAKDLKGMDTGLVRVGTFTSVSVQWMPHILKDFRQLYPHIDFEILPGDYGQIEEWIAQGRVDCGFLRLPTMRQLDGFLLHRDQLMVLLPPDHPLADRTVFPRKALEQYPFIQLEEGGDYEIGAVLDKLRVKPRVQYTVKEDQTLLAMVSNGLGISIMPELMTHHSPYPVVLLPLEQPFYRSIGLCLKDRSSCSLSTRRFMEHVKEWVAAHPGACITEE